MASNRENVYYTVVYTASQITKYMVRDATFFCSSILLASLFPLVVCLTKKAKSLVRGYFSLICIDIVGTV